MGQDQGIVWERCGGENQSGEDEPVIWGVNPCGRRAGHHVHVCGRVTHMWDKIGI